MKIELFIALDYWVGGHHETNRMAPFTSNCLLQQSRILADATGKLIFSFAFFTTLNCFIAHIAFEALLIFWSPRRIAVCMCCSWATDTPQNSNTWIIWIVTLTADSAGGLMEANFTGSIFHCDFEVDSNIMNLRNTQINEAKQINRTLSLFMENRNNYWFVIDKTCVQLFHKKHIIFIFYLEGAEFQLQDFFIIWERWWSWWNRSECFHKVVPEFFKGVKSWNML